MTIQVTLTEAEYEGFKQWRADGEKTTDVRAKLDVITKAIAHNLDGRLNSYYVQSSAFGAFQDAVQVILTTISHHLPKEAK